MTGTHTDHGGTSRGNVTNLTSVKRQRNEHAVSTQSPDKAVVYSKDEGFKRLEKFGNIPQSQVSKIQKAVFFIRDHKKFKKYFEPRALSFGPIHYGAKKLEPAEKYKYRLAYEFIKESGKDQETLYNMVYAKINELKDCFEEEVVESYDDEALAWVLFLDGCAILQFIYCTVYNEFESLGINDYVMVFGVHDLFLLENQLPYRLLELLMKLSNNKKETLLRESIKRLIDNVADYMLQEQPKQQEEKPNERKSTDSQRSQTHHTINMEGISSASQPEGTQESISEQRESTQVKILTAHINPGDPEIHEEEGDRSHLPASHSQPNPQQGTNTRGESTQSQLTHLLDLLRTRLLKGNSSQLPASHSQPNPQQGTNTRGESTQSQSIHLLDLLRTRLLGPRRTAPKKQNDNQWYSFRNVQELKSAGIHVKPNGSRSLRDISFSIRCHLYPAHLMLPPITVDDLTAPKFMNLIAYEMCPDFQNDYGVTSYISFLDNLIDNPIDVQELRKKGILNNCLGSDEEVAKLFNEIGTDLISDPNAYSDVNEKIQEFYNNKWMTWIAQAYHDHFSSPWTVTAFLGASAVLVLTGIQVWYAAHPPR